jgi:hypothetical protein
MKDKDVHGADNFLEKSVKSLTIYQLARLHLFNRHHVTTDEELRNAKIELSNVISVSQSNDFAVGSSTVIE